MKRSFVFTIIICLLFFSNYLYSKDILIPFEIDGKIGFVDQNLTIKFHPSYKKLLEYNKNIVLVRDFDLKYQVLVSNGQKFVAPELGYNSKAGLIGDNYYFFKVPIKEKELKSIFGCYEIYDTNGNVVSSFSDREIFSSSDPDWIYCEYCDENGQNIEDCMNINGVYKWKNNEILRIKAFYPEYNIGIVQKSDYTWTVVDEKGKFFINDNMVPELDFFSCGLSLGAIVNPWKKGYFNKDFQLIIEVERLPEFGRTFKCDVVPCVINNNKIYLYEPLSGEYSENWCIINTKGEIVKSGIEASNMSDFSDDGTAILRLYEKEKDLYRCWLVNSIGEKIHEAYFDEIKDSINGYSRAKKDGIDYLISSKNGTIYRCSDFDNLHIGKEVKFEN